MSKLHVSALPLPSYSVASLGKLRVVSWLRSEPHQVGEEVSTIEDARTVIACATQGDGPLAGACGVAPTIYNDEGKEIL